MEIKSLITDPHFPECPIRNVIARIGDKWSMLILLSLDTPQEWMRYKEIQQSIPDISQKMLTQTLRQLEADGLVERCTYAEVPPRVEYRLTQRARSLTPLLNELVQWAMAHLSGIVNDRKKFYGAE